MTTLDLDALQAAAEAATPGPWQLNTTRMGDKLLGWHIAAEKHGSLLPVCLSDKYNEFRDSDQEIANARLIAAANPVTILALIDRLRKAEAANQWQPIETAPKDGTHVLLWATRHSMLAPHPEFIVGAYRNGWWSGPSTLSHVTHWVPLPAAPTSANSEGAKG